MQNIMQYFWVLLAGAALLFIVTDGFKYFRKPKQEEKPVQKPALKKPEEAQPVGSQPENKKEADRQLVQRKGKRTGTSAAGRSYASNRSKGKNKSQVQEQPKKDETPKTAFEMDRDLYKKCCDIWGRCSKRDKSKGKELLCSTDYYCLNEFLVGGCSNPEFRKSMYDLKQKKALDILPYDEVHFDSNMEGVEWPPKDKYQDK